MSNTYPAGKFVIDSDVLRSAAGSVMIGNESWPIIEQAVLAKRDDELGRWRSKDHPEYLVYPKPHPNDDYVWVVNEVSPGMVSYPVRPGDTNESPYAAVAREYFDSTEPPKPWLAAKPGEVWVLTIDGFEEALLANGAKFTGRHGKVNAGDPFITAGRRIYPEADNV